MTSSLSRTALEADLLRYQDSGDFAAQADTLIALAKMAFEDEEYSLAQGLYGQAWTASQQISNPQQLAFIIHALADVLLKARRTSEFPLEFDLSDIGNIYELALASSLEIGDMCGQADIYKTLGTYRFYDEDRNRILLQQAFDLYETLGNVAEQAEVLESLVWTYEHQPDYQVQLERAYDFYHHIGDKRREGFAIWSLGKEAFWSTDYPEALSDFKAAVACFTDAKEYNSLVDVSLDVCRTIVEFDGYAAFRVYHQTAMQTLSVLPVSQSDLLRLWSLLPKMASKHQDFGTARYDYQRAIMQSVKSGDTVHQGELYWKWGCMEYYEAGYKSMGYALCLWAIVLADQSFPNQNRYRKKLRIMQNDLLSSKKRRQLS